MIPWKSGPKGLWSLTDPIEEIYLDDYAREQVQPPPVNEIDECRSSWPQIDQRSSTFGCRDGMLGSS